MRVLLTGMTAQQANLASHKRVNNFCGLLFDSLRENEHEVYWQDPDVHATLKDLEAFDRIIVGVAPITSLGANRTYGALHLMKLLWDKRNQRRLILLLDAPEPSKVTSSLRAIVDHPDNLLKEFFGYRKGYEAAVHMRDEMLEVVHRLHEEPWPRTVAPHLPWQGLDRVLPHLPVGAGYDMRLLNMDLMLFDSLPPLMKMAEREERWATEFGSHRRWAETQLTRWPYEPIPHAQRAKADPIAIEHISRCEATLLGPDRDGLWWSTRFAQSLSQETPVVTEWHQARRLGPEWGHLAGSVEETTSDGRRELAREQAASYLSAIGTQRMLSDTLASLLK